jgi:ribonuclease PH
VTLPHNDSTSALPARSGRDATELRSVEIERGASAYAEGSALISFGQTRVLCTASVETGVPGWRRGSGLGWITAEYAMLPRATHTRTARERAQLGGRTQEIQRLIGRSVRAMLDDFTFGEFTVRVDCDVLQADGGTRTAAITGASVAVRDAFAWMVAHGHVPASPVRRMVAAVSVGVVGAEPRLDLEYAEDVCAAVDMNVVMTSERRFVEVQGTGEHGTFDRAALDRLLELAQAGIAALFTAQERAVE